MKRHPEGSGANCQRDGCPASGWRRAIVLAANSRHPWLFEVCGAHAYLDGRTLSVAQFRATFGFRP